MEIEKNKRIITQIMFSISISLKFYFYNTSFVSINEISPMRRFKDVFYWTVTLSMNGSCHSGNRPRYLQHTARAYLKKENLTGVIKPLGDISDHVFEKNKLSITDGKAEIKELSHTSYSALLCHFSSTLKHTVGNNSGDRSMRRLKDGYFIEQLHLSMNGNCLLFWQWTTTNLWRDPIASTETNIVVSVRCFMIMV